MSALLPPDVARDHAETARRQTIELAYEGARCAPLAVRYPRADSPPILRQLAELRKKGCA